MPLFFSAAALGTLWAFFGGAPSPHDIEALARDLGDAGGTDVEASSIRWDTSLGVWGDAVVGRRCFFLGGPAGRARDVYVARVRLTPDGRPLRVWATRNLTATPFADEHALTVGADWAAFATFAFHQEQGITALDLAGAQDDNDPGLAEQAMRALSRFIDTGSFRGLGRVDVTFDDPVASVSLALGKEGAASGALRVERVVGETVRRGVLDLRKADAPLGLRAERAPVPSKRAIHWAVDVARAAVGPAPIAWAEEKAFAVRDGVRRGWHAVTSLGSDDDGRALAAAQWAPRDAAEDDGATRRGGTATPVAAARGDLLDGSRASDDDVPWPPPTVTAATGSEEPGEGRWTLPRIPWLRRLPNVGDDAPAPFARTFVRPDPSRPYSRVTLVAMDMRQLELGMEAGLEDPKPLAGAHGSGRVPREPAKYRRLVGMFNGAFKTDHGAYGMMVDRRVLLPAKPGAATVASLRDGRVAMGTWPESGTPAPEGLDERNVVSYRQNLEPLLDGERLNPARRAQWGFTLPGTSSQTERSGLCVTAHGHLVYAWGEDVNANALAKAMKLAGCTYGMHLDMNPHHTAFVFATVDDMKAKKWRTQLLEKEMDVWPEKYLEGAQKDFFYLLLKDPAPPPGEVSWVVSAGAQPAPKYLPAIWEATVATSEGSVELWSVAAHRAHFRVRGGAREPDTKLGVEAHRELSAEEAARVLFSVGAGTCWEKRLRGLSTAGRQVFAAHGGTVDSPSALVVAPPAGALQIARIEELGGLPPRADLVELPLLFDGEDTFPLASARGHDHARMAMGVTATGQVVIARAAAPSNAPLVAALRAAHVRRAVLLDRGVRGVGAFNRAGTARSPRSRNEETTLYALAAPMKGGAFRFPPESAPASEPSAQTTVPTQ